jgi:hypothetical protein
MHEALEVRQPAHVGTQEMKKLSAAAIKRIGPDAELRRYVNAAVASLDSAVQLAHDGTDQELFENLDSLCYRLRTISDNLQ